MSESESPVLAELSPKSRRYSEDFNRDAVRLASRTVPGRGGTASRKQTASQIAQAGRVSQSHQAIDPTGACRSWA